MFRGLQLETLVAVELDLLTMIRLTVKKLLGTDIFQDASTSDFFNIRIIIYFKSNVTKIQCVKKCPEKVQN